MTNHPSHSDDPIRTASTEVHTIIANVLRLEKDKLYMDRPRIKDDIVHIIKAVIREA